MSNELFYFIFASVCTGWGGIDIRETSKIGDITKQSKAKHSPHLHEIPSPPLSTEHKSTSALAAIVSQFGLTLPCTRRRAMPPSGNMLSLRCVTRPNPLTSKKWCRDSAYLRAARCGMIDPQR